MISVVQVWWERYVQLKGKCDLMEAHDSFAYIPVIGQFDSSSSTKSTAHSAQNIIAFEKAIGNINSLPNEGY